jgi:hypothetical protein
MARDAKGRWQPGRSGNPKGKAKISKVGLGFSAAIRELVGEQGEKLIALAWTCAQDEEAPWGHRLDAIKWLAERAFGRAMEVTAEGGDLPGGIGVEGRALDEFTDEELRQIVRELERREVPA